MKKILLFICMILMCYGYSQASDNRFNNEGNAEQYHDTSTSTYEEGGDVAQKVPSNPGDPTPIDGGIVGLLLVGVTLISYFILKKRINHVK
ncbi:hypothetical protein [Soonwooa sp.]|uniref:hypothetical protein n=1 Tax=Soonwooa sp. TaxID=1938592 RepID=UPI0028ADBEFE|nr:hypothetical protein [Soonwooa sp.]